MRLFRLFAILAVSMVAFTSCSVVKYGTYRPDAVQLNITMNDLEELGVVDISVEYSKYLGFIKVIKSINGELYDGKVINNVSIPNHLAGVIDAPLNRAIYKVFEQYPDAEYLVVSHTQSNKTRLFLGSETSTTAKIRAYKFK
jgi:hypothetical protein